MGTAGALNLVSKYRFSLKATKLVLELGLGNDQVNLEDLMSRREGPDGRIVRTCPKDREAVREELPLAEWGSFEHPNIWC